MSSILIKEYLASSNEENSLPSFQVNFQLKPKNQNDSDLIKSAWVYCEAHSIPEKYCHCKNSDFEEMQNEKDNQYSYCIDGAAQFFRAD